MSSSSTSPGTSSSGSHKSSVPVSQKLLALAQTTHFAWFAAHCIQLSGAIFYLLFSFRLLFKSPSFPLFWYRLSYIAGILNYFVALKGAVPVKGLQVDLAKAVRNSNFHYLMLCFVWLFTKPYFMTLIPFAIFSFYHIVGYLRAFIFPTLGYSPQSWPVVQASVIARDYSDMGFLMAANVEFTNYLRVIMDLFSFRKQAVIVFVLYTFFMKARYDDSLFSRTVVQAWEVRVDSLLSHQALPPVIKQTWVTFKQYIRAYMGRISLAPQVAKKSQ